MTSQDITRGAKAKAILEDQLFKDSVELVQKSIFDEFALCEQNDLDKMRNLRIKLNALADVVRNIESVMRTGILAEAEREHEKTMVERAKARLSRGLRGV